ncbi:MAG: carboxypeptidase regulatory-like domain-containing protein [Candidatus Latescibacteria bacterium]|nr:carboxypeptidase regulatory-like domain-containing protein [Candidatus Latescibacterota bacterium]
MKKLMAMSLSKKILFYILFLPVIVSAGCDDNKVTGDDSGKGTYSVFGKIYYESGVGVENVLVNLFGYADDEGTDIKINMSVSTDSNGAYLFKNIPNGSYTITPMRSKFVFSPDNYQITVNGMNLSIPSFTGAAMSDGNGSGGNAEYTVSGRVVDTSGAGMADISIGLAGESLGLNALTNSQGYYSFRNVANGTYTIAPGKEGYVFSPTYKTIRVSGYDITVETFIGETTDEQDGNAGGFAGTHVYYPVSKNASWTIKRIDTDFTAGNVIEYEYTLRVTGTKLVNDKEYWIIMNDDNKIDSFVRIEDEVMYTFTDFASVYYSSDYTLRKTSLIERYNTLSLFSKTTSDGDWDPTINELPLLQLNISPGTNYEIMRYSKSESGGNFTLTWLGTYTGTEDVTVSAGTFPNCKKYEILYDAVAVAGGAYGRDTTTTELWLAPDVGVVKLTEKKVSGSDTVLIREEELIGFSIP